MIDNIEKKLIKIKKIFNIDDIIKLNVNNDYIKKYYNINLLSYSIFHHNKLLHSGLSKNGHYKVEDLLEPIKYVEKHIKNRTGLKVLELGMGRGGNLIYLADKYKENYFYGIDFSPAHLKIALKNKKENYFPSYGDYHNLKKYKKDFFDIVFTVEALCHSINKYKVLKEVYRILKKGGVFIIVDGYSYNKKLNETQKIALNIVEKGLALKKFENYYDFRKKIIKSGFKIVYEKDASRNVLPTFKRMEWFARAFFKISFLAKLIAKIFPEEFVLNVNSGYLLKDMIISKIMCYKITILRK